MDLSDPLSPAMERLWIDEVRRLHALWHAGPPRHSDTPPLSGSIRTKLRLQKRQKKKEFKKQQRKQKQLQEQLNSSSNPRSQSDPSGSNPIKWPSPKPESPDNEMRAWGDSNEGKTELTPSKPLSAEEQARIVALRVQKDSVEALRAFFSDQCLSDDEEDPMDDDGDSDGDGDSRYFRFFVDVFEKDGDLRGYYERNWEKGEFCCLVCDAIGERRGRRFTDCVSMIQHLNSISRTKRKEAHRALARVLCRVLGWNMERLPSIVLDVGHQIVQPLGSTDIPDLQEVGGVDRKEELLGDVSEHAETTNEDTMDVIEKKEDEVEGEIEEKNGDQIKVQILSGSVS